MTKEEAKKDKYYRRKYNISLDDYKKLLAGQRGCCAICSRHHSEFSKALSVDHDHAIAKTKISAQKFNNSWLASANIGGRVIDHLHEKKSSAIKAVRLKLLTLSVRGLLDWRCNTALQKFRDNSQLMENAANYIKRYQKCLALG